MKKLLLLALLLPLAAYAEQRTVGEYGKADVYTFEMYNADGTLDIDEVDGGTEVTIRCITSASSTSSGTATNDFVDVGTQYAIDLTGAELECDTAVLEVGATLQHAVIIETCGSPNAHHMNCPGGPYRSGGTAQAGSTTSTTLAATEAYADDVLTGDAIFLVEDTGIGQAACITGNTLSTDVANHTTIDTAAASGTEYIIVPDFCSPVNTTNGIIEAKMMSTDTAAITATSMAADSIGASELATDAIGAAEIADDAIGADEMATAAIDADAIATDAIGAAELAADAGAEIWAVSCEDQGGAYSCRETMSLLLSEAMGTCVYTSGTRTWVCSDPSGTETRFTLVYGAELDGDRSTSTPAPMTP